jgi:RNA polymerase sigma factor (sigma-70 family)
MEILLASNTMSSSRSTITSPLRRVPVLGIRRKELSPEAVIGYAWYGADAEFRTRPAILPEARSNLELEAGATLMSEPHAPPDGPDERQIVEVYAQHYRLLEYVAIQRFRVPAEDVLPLVHDVFVSYLRNRTRVRDTRSWLVGAMYNACKDYVDRRPTPSSDWSQQQRYAVPEPIAERVDLVAVLAQLPPQCREVLHRRFLLGYSTEEVASWLGKTANNAKQIIHRCKARARALFVRRRGGA